MPNNQHTNLSAIRARMVTTSLVVSVVVGLLLFAAGGGVLAVLSAVATALFSSLICGTSLRNSIARIRLEQSRAMARLLPAEDLSAIQAEQDDMRALMSSWSVVMETLESRQKERQRLLDRIIASEEQLKVIIHSLMTGDEKEIAQVRDAVTVMESMNSSFTLVIVELDELSGRAEDRAAISGEMSATTDAIAENINQYSTFVIETSSSIEQMARAISETAANIRGLSASTEQTVSSINQISDSQANVRDNAERSASASENVRSQAQQGLRSMVATLKAMHEIETSNDESFNAINRLSRHSARVGEFLSVIQEVVEQTNLLSLNASIIAAQAGERGRAFAVVAEEVRSLARRTSASTKEIEELVRNIQKETAAVQRSVTQGKDKVKEGVKISSMANEALVVIEKSAEDASRMGARIASEITEQATDIQRITEEAEKNLERVQQITLNTAHQQEGTTLIVKNLEQMRELAQRINFSAQEQAKGNRLYLKSVMEDSERTQQLKQDASAQIDVARKAVAAVQRVETLIASNAVESRKIMDGITTLTRLIDEYRGETVMETEGEELSYE
jgi:methyl-accepting chemotaxis protein